MQACETDSGMVQIDSLRLDVDGNGAAAAALLWRDFEPRVAAKASYLARLGAVWSSPTCRRWHSPRPRAAGVPSVAGGQLHLGLDLRVLSGVRRARAGRHRHHRCGAIRRGQGARLPIRGGFELGRGGDRRRAVHRAALDPRSRRDAASAEDGVAGQRCVLSSFGGYGLALPCDAHRAPGLTVLSPNGIRPPARTTKTWSPRRRGGQQAGLRHRVGVRRERHAALCTRRAARFAEYDVMVAEMPRMLRCRHISQDDLLEPAAGAKRSRRCSRSQRRPERPRVDGAESPSPASVDLIEQLTPRWLSSPLAQVTSDQIRGKFTFSIEIGLSSA